MTARHTPTRVAGRAGALLAGAVLALGLAGCGDNSDSEADSGGPDSSAGPGDPGSSAGTGDPGSSGSSAGPGDSGRSAPAGTPEEAYANFAGAIESGNADAFAAAVLDQYWSDLTGEQDDNAVNLAAHHWAVENDVLRLPADPGAVLTGDEALGDHAEPGAAEDYATTLESMLGLDDLTGDDLAVITVADAFDSGLADLADSENCIADDRAIDECLDDTSSSGREAVSVILVRGDDGWQVFGTEPAH